MNRIDMQIMRSRILLIAFSLTLAAGLQAQQDPMYSMYMWNMMTLNPGYAGSNDVLNVTALSRVQWASINGAPVTHSLSAHAPVNRRSLGLGGSVVNDHIGRSNTLSAFADLSYRIRLSHKTRLAFGLKAGINHASIANTQVENTDPNDPTFMADISGRVSPNFGFGTYLWSKKGYVGLSVPKLLRNYLGKVGNDGIATTFQQEATHVFLTGGYVFPLGTVKFKPSMMVRASEGAPLSVDVAASFFLRDRLSLGAMYRYGSSVTGIFSVQLNDQFRAGYAYDLGVSSYTQRAGGTHEIMFSYDPVFTRERVRSPRYF
jgi:type IX secretion system PorP/SprF family membrane protein